MKQKLTRKSGKIPARNFEIVWMEPLTLIKLDELELRRRFDLNATDQCRYWRTYTPKENYHLSDTNRLIQNFKISPLEKHRLPHKKSAIEQIAHEFIKIVPDQVYQNFTKAIGFSVF